MVDPIVLRDLRRNTSLAGSAGSTDIPLQIELIDCLTTLQLTEENIFSALC